MRQYMNKYVAMGMSYKPGLYSSAGEAILDNAPEEYKRARISVSFPAKDFSDDPEELRMIERWFEIGDRMDCKRRQKINSPEDLADLI